MRHYNKRNPKEIEEIMQRLVGLMMMEHVGKENQITVPELEEKLGIRNESDRNGFRTRNEILKMMERSPIPFGATTKGIYVISNEKELNDYIVSLERRSKSITDRIATVTRAYKRMRKVN